jgi:hypothetical protein
VIVRSRILLLLLSFVIFSESSAQTDLQETISARSKIFGLEHVSPLTGELPNDKVIFSWLSNSTFAASIEGRVILLDTFITRLELTPGRSPIVIKDMLDLAPEAILLGHGHGDHADNAAYIAAKTGAVIYATEESCGIMQRDFERMRNDPLIQENPETRFGINASVECISVTSAGSVPGTELLQLNVLEPNVCVLAFRHLHSVAVPPDPDFPPTPVQIIVDPRDAELFPEGISLTPDGDAIPGQMNLRATRDPGGDQSLFFSFILRNNEHFSFVFHNTAGALKEGIGRGWDGTPADGQRVIDILESLPPTDVQLGTASSGNFNNNGLRDLIMYQEALQPRIYIPNHITSGTATREASSLSVFAGYLSQLDLMGMPEEQRPEIRWLIDPTDFLKPIVFDSTANLWSNPLKEERMNQLCSSL